MELNIKMSFEKGEIKTFLDMVNQIEGSCEATFIKINILNKEERELIFKGGYIESGEYITINKYRFGHHNFRNNIINIVEVWVNGKDIEVERIDEKLWKVVYLVKEFDP